MTVSTSQPGVQFYSGNFIKEMIGKNGEMYEQYGGLCLETQNYPDGPNQPKFPNCILKAGDKYKTKTIFHFDW